MVTTREERVRKALFKGATLRLENPLYFRSVRNVLKELLASDLGAGDLSVQCLQLEADRAGATAAVIAKSPGVAAGLCEFAWLFGRGGMTVQLLKKDGDAVDRGDTLLEMQGRRADLLAYERVGLNLVQRMSGIATATRRSQDRVHAINAGAQVVATRKTPWGLLDKRAVHLGGGGTHRLGLWDAIMVKNNHLALLADREEEAVGIAAQRAWAFRDKAGFLEIEVRSLASVVGAARAFRELQRADTQSESEPGSCPCLLLLDNMSPQEMSSVADALRAESLLDHVLLEASGNVTEDNLEAYASCGIDAISMGALTHSARALDLSQTLFNSAFRNATHTAVLSEK
jgi:nicotinate-nucleotide pyrophosphorylase (carboxylating)